MVQTNWDSPCLVPRNRWRLPIPISNFPRLSWGPQGLETKESRREALSRLDYLLEQLERANLAELPNPPSGVVRELIGGGLSNPMTYTIPHLIEIVFNSQELLMRANKDLYRTRVPDSDHDDRDRHGYSSVLSQRFASKIAGCWRRSRRPS